MLRKKGVMLLSVIRWLKYCHKTRPPDRSSSTTSCWCLWFLLWAPENLMNHHCERLDCWWKGWKTASRLTFIWVIHISLLEKRRNIFKETSPVAGRDLTLDSYELHEWEPAHTSWESCSTIYWVYAFSCFQNSLIQSFILSSLCSNQLKSWSRHSLPSFIRLL